MGALKKGGPTRMSSGQTNFPPPTYPLKGEFIFENKQVQNAANTVYEDKASKGKTYQFKTDRERMQYLIGRQGRVVHSTVVPTPPLMVVGTIGNGSVTLNWTVPLKSEAPVLYYKIVSNPPTTTVLSVTTSTLITGLTNGTPYTFSVTAKNVAGFSLPGISAPLTPATVPSPPLNVVATAGIGQATVSWDPPVTNGGSVIEEYVVTSTPDSQQSTATFPETTATVTGLTNETPYTFTVEALNAIGASLQSAPSNSVTPTNPNASVVFRIMIIGNLDVSPLVIVIRNRLHDLGYTNSGIIFNTVVDDNYNGNSILKANIDVVYIFSKPTFQGRSGLGAALSTFVAAGGHVISSSLIWSLAPPDMDYTVTPFQAHELTNSPTGNYAIDVVNPITTGIELSLGVGSIISNGAVSLQSGATTIAHFTSTGYPFIAINSVSSANLVGFNAYMSYNKDAAVQLIVNAILWVTGNLPS